MPPRFAYWTIILDDGPTAFRAKDRAELLGVFRQLAHRNPGAVMKWFSHGKLWDSPEEEREARRAAEQAQRRERRGPDWRPGGKHADPRARFDKRHAKRAERPGRHRDDRPHDRRPVRGRTFGRPRARGAETPSEPERPTPPRPPGTERPPQPEQEPTPERPQPETIRILPEPPERATPGSKKR